jgi:hypothetical protein
MVMWIYRSYVVLMAAFAVLATVMIIRRHRRVKAGAARPSVRYVFGFVLVGIAALVGLLGALSRGDGPPTMTITGFAALILAVAGFVLFLMTPRDEA